MGARNLGAQEERQREFPEYRYTAVLEIKQTGKMEGPKGYLQEKKMVVDTVFNIV